MSEAAHPLLTLPARPDAAIARRRTLRAFGADAELVLLPDRARRAGVPGERTAPFLTPVAERIIADEALWEDATLAATPNRFPFGANPLVLWAKSETREAPTELLGLMGELADAAGATALANTIGAAASISRSHGHVLMERLPFLEKIPEIEVDAPWLDRRPDLQLVRKDLPYTLFGLRGPATARARGARRALELRATAAVSIVDTGGTTWIMPRSGIEIPTPHFPHAVGAAEAWGRWCHVDESAFEAATNEDLETALTLSGVPWSE